MLAVSPVNWILPFVPSQVVGLVIVPRFGVGLVQGGAVAVREMVLVLKVRQTTPL